MSAAGPRATSTGGGAASSLFGARVVADQSESGGASSPAEHCDRLCEDYDKSSRDVGQQLLDCGLPADLKRRYMDVVYLWVNASSHSGPSKGEFELRCFVLVLCLV